MIDSTSGYKHDNTQEKEFTFKSSSVRTIDAESTSKSVGVISGQVSPFLTLPIANRKCENKAAFTK